jgi:cytochrome P450
LEPIRNEAIRFFSDPDARRNPESFYRRVTTEAPVVSLGPLWLVSGYEEIRYLARHPLTSVNPSVGGVTVPLSPVSALATLLSNTLAVRDGKDHRRLKRLAIGTFSAGNVAAHADLLSAVVDELMAEPLEAGAIDVVADLAVPLPVAISCALLGIPSSDRTLVQSWSTLLTLGSGRSAHPSVNHLLQRRADDLLEYIAALCNDRKRSPGDDLISRLVLANAAGELDDLELAAYIVMLFANGLETLTSGISVSVWELVRDPALVERIRQDPDLAGPLFEECLRLHTPVRASSRALTGDAEVGGQLLGRGDVAVLLYAAGNRDPRVFAEPDRLDPDRDSRAHLAFGHGSHHCLGASLSVGAGPLVLRRLAERCSNLSTPVGPAELAWNESFVFNGLRSLPLSFDPVGAVSAGDG